MRSMNGCSLLRWASSFVVFISLAILTACGGGSSGATSNGATTSTNNNPTTATPSTTNPTAGNPTTNPTTGDPATGGSTTNGGTTNSTDTNVIAPISGSTLYQTNCQGCHHPLSESTKVNKTAAEIQAAISNNTGGMGSLVGLSATEVQAIADALKTTQVIPTFDTTHSTTFQLNGSAILNNNSIRLTPNERYTAGTAFLNSPFTLNSNFVFNAYFTFTLGAGGRSSRHADGFVFALQTLSNKAGGSGGNLGFGGIVPSFGVEFDTYWNDMNNDPNDNHVALVTNGSVLHEVAAPVIPTVMMSDGGTYHVWVDYNGTTMEVRINTTNDRSGATLVLTQAVDLKSIFSNQDVYFGFTGATGNDSQTHDIGAFSVTSNYKSGGISPSP